MANDLRVQQSTPEPWGTRMGRLEAETGGECSAGDSVLSRFIRDPFNNPPP
jgi:hypothetical protein